MSLKSADFRWLHISDFHFKSGDPYDRDVVLNAFLHSLPNLLERSCGVDFIVASGDIGHSGAEDEYRSATAFFDRLLAETGLSKEKIVIIPGNHDVDRTAGKGLARSIESSEDADQYFGQSEPLLHLQTRQGAFGKWYDSFYAGIRSFPLDRTVSALEQLEVGGRCIAVLPINSATFSFDNSDHGRLRVGRRSLEVPLDTLKAGSADFKMAVVHHPHTWLHSDESRSFKTLMQSNFDVVLSGHLHQTDVDNVTGIAGGTALLSAGAMYQTRKYPNTAMFCGVSGSELTVFPIRYEDKPLSVWTTDTSLFPKNTHYLGTFQLTQRGGSSATDMSAAITPDIDAGLAALDATTTETRLEFERDLFVTPANRLIYVEPRIKNKAQTYSVDDDNSAEIVELNDILHSTNSYVIVSRSEHGATSLCKRLILELKTLAVPAVLRDARLLPKYKKKLETEFSSTISGSVRPVLILDNFNPERDERLIRELDSSKLFSRLIVMYSSRGLRPATFSDVVGTSFDFKTAYLWTSNREDIREIAKNLFETEDDVYLSRIVDKTYNDLLALCIPLTPSNIVMYLRVLHKEGEFHPLNRVDIVARYLTELLRGPDDAYAESFSAKNKLDILSAFSHQMYLDERTDFDEQYWLDFCKSYQDETLTEFNSTNFLEEIMNSRIAVKWSDRIFIKYSFFFQYFLGRYISSKDKLLRSFMDEEKYLKISGVIDVITGIRSENTLIVSSLTQKLNENLQQFSDKYIEKDFDPFQDALWPNTVDDESFWNYVNGKIQEGPRANSEIDAVKTSIYAEARTTVQEVTYYKFIEVERTLFYIATLLADALRNSDDVSGKLKVEALDAVMQSHLVAFQIGAVFSTILAERRSFSWGAITFLDFDQAAKDLDPHSVEAKNAVAMALNREIAATAARELGTSKLSGVFKERERQQPPIGFKELVNFSCLVSSKGKNWVDASLAIIGRTDKNAFYLRAMLATLMRELDVEVLRASDRDSIRRLVATIHAKRSGGKQNPGAKLVGRYLGVLDKNKGAQ